MKILFGAELDGCPAQGEWVGVGKFVCGPQGLLNLLEVAVGLPQANAVSDLERVLSYREAASEFLEANPEAFFAQSFSVDSLAASRVLLRWRDELRLAGWSFEVSNSEEIPMRLVDMAGVEAGSADDALFREGIAERLERVQAKLESGARTGITSVVVIDPKESIPAKWINLLKQLDASFDPCLPAAPIAQEGTQLHLLQSRILGVGDEEPAGGETSPDQSVVVWQGFSERNLARAAAQHWRESALGPKSLLIALPESRGRLNDSFRQLDLPEVAARESSLSASLTQLLPLCLRLHWQPFAPQALLEFLLHPICPVPGSLRYSLARAINGTPGRGNHAWKKAIKRALERVGNDVAGKQKLESAISSWIELPRYDREGGISGEQVASTARQLAAWLRSVGAAKRGIREEDALMWLSVAGKVESFGRAIHSQPQVSYQELERLIASWLSSAGESSQERGELGSSIPVAGPGQILSSIGNIFWWEPGPRGKYRRPWIRREREWLSAGGVRLITSQASLEAEEASNLRAILQAGESLSIFVTHGESGEQISPVVTRIIAELGSRVVRDVSDQIETVPLAVTPLPPIRRWWTISDPSLLVPREKESYSSISKLIYSPYQWVLNYRARLESGQLFGFGVGDDSKRRGTLLHDLAECLFAPDLEAGDSAVDWINFDETDLQQWIDSIWTGLLDERGAQYRLPGLESARNGLLHTGRQALWQLVSHFQEAGVTEIEVEKYIDDIDFVGGKLNGRIDLVARTPDAVAVVDLKLGGKSLRRTEVAENRHLQLAVYGRLLRESEGAQPCTAFFILGRGGTLLTRSKEFFPGSTPVPLKNAADTSEWEGCWNEFEKIWQWRRTQLDAGRIEITVGGTDPDEIPPLEHWAAPEDADFYNDFNALTGWPRTS